MAEAVIETVLGSLSSLAQNEIGLFLGFDQEFEKISSLLTTIKATLEDAEEKQFTDKAIQNWLQKLKDAAHVLDDILDECATNTTRKMCFSFKLFSVGHDTDANSVTNTSVRWTLELFCI
ncbi:unnamed protein product [Trifolium pratense]|uniref:Uncharacterized protein n=1 Tax=Trifolium pratense TaxID=57577 RepID=A0ACB0JPE9_TRIPR|nr:unnamed protein product [Trifolium pratense]